MRFIIIDSVSSRVKSVADLPFDYEYPTQEGDELVIGHEDYTFNLMSYDYFFSDENFIEVSKA